jgi:hypothetical protein
MDRTGVFRRTVTPLARTRSCRASTRAPIPPTSETKALALDASGPAEARFRASGPHSARERAVVVLHRDELRKRRAYGELVRIAGRDASQEGRHQAIGRLPPEPAGRESRDGFVLVPLVAPRGDERLERHPQLASPT